MSDTVKLIIEIPRNEYEYTCERTLSDRTFWDDAIRKGVPFDNVKAKIADIETYERDGCWVMADVWKVLNNIGKESEEI